MEALQTQIGGDHYKSMAIQPLEFCLLNRIPFAEGNIIKYVCRFRDKGGKEDLEKALHYLEALIEAEYPEQKSVAQMAAELMLPQEKIYCEGDLDALDDE